VVKPISPYLLRPLRSLDQALRDLEREPVEADTPSQTKSPPAPEPPPASAGKPGNPQDTVTIAGQAVAIEPGAPVTPATGGQLDVKA
jgi:hypothetical protein